MASGQPHGRPDGIATTHPVPHGEAVVRMDAEGVHGRPVHRHRREMLGHGALAQCRGQPALGSAGIGQGLERGEGLGADDEQGSAGVGTLKHIGQAAAIDVGRERHAGRRIAEPPQRLHRHGRAQVGAPDADVYHQLKRLAAAAQNPAGAGRPRRNPARDSAFGKHQVGMRGARPAQRRMQNLARLSGVGDPAFVHVADAGAKIQLIGHRPEKVQRCHRHPLAREIRHEPRARHDEASAPAVVGSKQLGYRRQARFSLAGQLGPRGSGYGIGFHALSLAMGSATGAPFATPVEGFNRIRPGSTPGTTPRRP